jgi:hypothetical protein
VPRRSGSLPQHVVVSLSLNVAGSLLSYRATDCLGPRVARLSTQGPRFLPAPISLRLPPECWWFIQIMRSSPTGVPLPDDVLAALSRAPGVEIITSVPEPRIVVDLTRTQAEVLQRWLQALLDDFPQEDDRWRTCLHCWSRCRRDPALGDVAAAMGSVCHVRSFADRGPPRELLGSA